MDKIPVTVDKSHLITIGERLYTENVELLRELVNNSYDADATEVKITINDNEVIVEDNGIGMDIEGLKQYFNIGSPYKRENPKSIKFGRYRIGEFGIGKFSVLSNCEYFEVFTKKDKFAGRVIFDRKDWENNKDRWDLPLYIENPNLNDPDGTKVILKGLKKKFDIEIVEKRLIETLPLKAEKFAVFINGKKLVPRTLTGRKIPFLEGTDYGIVHGEIVILPAALHIKPEEAGILVRVKQVAVKRLGFGLDSSLLMRISGEVNADFLLLTTDRNDFLRDTREFDEFLKVMNKIIEQVKNEIERQTDEKENSRVKRALKEVIKNIEHALLKNKDWAPPGLLPIEEKSNIKEELEIQNKSQQRKERKKRIKKPHLKQLSASALVKKVKIGKMNMALIVDHFGTDGAESFIEGDIIYINRDHPIYIRESVNRERHIMNITRLICQEISLMSNPKNPRHAYERQSKLLKDALIK